jgi:ATP-dependent exoDNAse (exonuclease V) beta subunit
MFTEATFRNVTESLCVLYVAVTRAVHGLYMIVAPSSPKERNLPCTYAGLLRAALCDPRRAEPESVLYRHGDPRWYAPAGRPGVEPEPPPAERQPDPLAAVAVALPRLDDDSARRRGWERARPSGLEGGTSIHVSQVLGSSRTAAFLQGELIHAWFEQIVWLEDGRPDEQTLRSVWDHVVAGGQPGELQFAEQRARFDQMLDKPALAGLLSRQRYARMRDLAYPPELLQKLKRQQPLTMTAQNERGFALRQDGQLLNGFIDRLVLLRHGSSLAAAEVIDYKTDALDPDDPRQLADKVAFYRPQLDAYRQSVSQLTGLSVERVAATLAFVAIGRLASV